MTIQSTAHTAQARHTPPRSQEKRSSNKQKLAQVKIVREPGRSIKDLPDEHGDWYFFRVDHVNSKCKQWTINCREWQKSWVLEQQECNVQLVEGLHFDFVHNAVQVEDGWQSRHVLDEEYFLVEPEPEEEPMTWSQPGQELPVIAQPEAPNQIVALASEHMTNWLTLRQTYQEFAGIPNFDDIAFRAVISASITVERNS